MTSAKPGVLIFRIIGMRVTDQVVRYSKNSSREIYQGNNLPICPLSRGSYVMGIRTRNFGEHVVTAFGPQSIFNFQFYGEKNVEIHVYLSCRILRSGAVT